MDPKFRSTVKPSGGDYSTLATAENGLDYTGAPCDLTSSSCLTAAYDGAVGDPILITGGEAQISAGLSRIFDNKYVAA